MITIDCPECGGRGYTAEHDPCDPHINGECINCPIQVQCVHCKDGKITVYTEKELQEKIGYVEGLYTPEELEKAVREEREACISDCIDIKVKYGLSKRRDFRDYDMVADECAEAIRARSEK
jgi:hypothetical protein